MIKYDMYDKVNTYIPYYRKLMKLMRIWEIRVNLGRRVNFCER